VTSAGARVRRLQAGDVQGYQRLAYAALLALLAAALLSPSIGVLASAALAVAVLVVAGVIALRGA